jgi:uncharacterized protein YidB (DUF937 family)
MDLWCRPKWPGIQTPKPVLSAELRLDLVRQKQSESGTDVAQFTQRGSAMGILDSLQNSPAFKNALGQLEGAVLPAVLGEVLGSGSQGGLSAIVAKLQQAGLGDQVKSWLGNGQNLPITAQQLQEVLGSDAVRQLAAKYNIPVDQITQILAQQLPNAVDKASPDGKLPHSA